MCAKAILGDEIATKKISTRWLDMIKIGHLAPKQTPPPKKMGKEKKTMVNLKGISCNRSSFLDCLCLIFVELCFLQAKKVYVLLALIIRHFLQV